MYPPNSNDNNIKTSRRRQSRKRARPNTNHIMPKATLVTSLLWLVAFTTTNPSSTVKAFVLANDRPSHRTLHKPPQQSQLSIAPDVSNPLWVSTLADLEVPSSQLEDLLQGEERAEDVLDLANHPLLLIPSDNLKDSQGQELQAQIPDEEQVLEWAHRYTSVEALREHFGTNQNKLWGDLQASTARRLYKTLLPRALLELSKLNNIHPQDLAPLAYQARVAAKLYARERCTVPARLAATLFDGFRQWIKYGKFQAHGMTYDQIWEKYAEKILQETETEHLLSSFHHDVVDDEECYLFDNHSDCEEEEDLFTEQVCRKILERACASNEKVDALALKGQDLADETELQPNQRRLLEQIRSQLENDMYQLLLPPGVDRTDPEEEETRLPQLHLTTRDRLEQGKFRLVKGLARQRRAFWKQRSKTRKEAEVEKPWTRSRSKPWLSRSRETVDQSDSEGTEATDDESVDEYL